MALPNISNNRDNSVSEETIKNIISAIKSSQNISFEQKPQARNVQESDTLKYTNKQLTDIKKVLISINDNFAKKLKEDTLRRQLEENLAGSKTKDYEAQRKTAEKVSLKDAKEAESAVGLGLGSIIVGIGLLGKKIYDSLKKLVLSFKDLKKTFSQSFDKVKDFFEDFGKKIQDIFKKLGAPLIALKDKLGKTFEKFGDSFKTLKEKLAEMLSSFSSKVGVIFSGLGLKIKSTLGSVSKKIESVISKIGNGGELGKITSKITANLSTFGKTVGTIFTSLVLNIRQILSSLATKSKSLVPSISKLGKGGGLLGIGVGMGMDYGADKLEESGHPAAAGGVRAGSDVLSGAGWGAMVGSVVPGVGTAVGAGVGAAIGAGVGIYNNVVNPQQPGAIPAQSGATMPQQPGATIARVPAVQPAVPNQQYVPTKPAQVQQQRQISRVAPEEIEEEEEEEEITETAYRERPTNPIQKFFQSLSIPGLSGLGSEKDPRKMGDEIAGSFKNMAGETMRQVSPSPVSGVAPDAFEKQKPTQATGVQIERQAPSSVSDDKFKAKETRRFGGVGETLKRIKKFFGGEEEETRTGRYLGTPGKAGSGRIRTHYDNAGIKDPSRPMSQEEFNNERVPKIGNIAEGGGTFKLGKLAPHLQDTSADRLQKTMGISKAEYDVFRGSIAKIESRGGQYGIKGGSSNRFSGAYQMGATEIRDSAKALGMSPPSREEFLSNPQLQETLFDKYTEMHHHQLMKNKIYAGMSKKEQLAVLGYAHNQGAGGASKWLKTGKEGRDAFGTGGTKYSKEIGKNLSALERGEIKSADADKTPSASYSKTKREDIGKEATPEKSGGYSKKEYEEAYKFIKSRSADSKDIKNLDADYAVKLSKFMKDAESEFGEKTSLASGFRAPTKDIRSKLGSTGTDQETIYKKSGGSGYAARPFHSMHDTGVAADISIGGRTIGKSGTMNKMSPEMRKKWLELAEKNELNVPMTKGKSSVHEEWHIEPKGVKRGGSSAYGLEGQEYTDYIKGRRIVDAAEKGSPSVAAVWDKDGKTRVASGPKQPDKYGPPEKKAVPQKEEPERPEEPEKEPETASLSESEKSVTGLFESLSISSVLDKLASGADPKKLGDQIAKSFKNITGTDSLKPPLQLAKNEKQYSEDGGEEEEEEEEEITETARKELTNKSEKNTSRQISLPDNKQITGEKSLQNLNTKFMSENYGMTNDFPTFNNENQNSPYGNQNPYYGNQTPTYGNPEMGRRIGNAASTIGGIMGTIDGMSGGKMGNIPGMIGMGGQVLGEVMGGNMMGGLGSVLGGIGGMTGSGIPGMIGAGVDIAGQIGGMMGGGMNSGNIMGGLGSILGAAGGMTGSGIPGMIGAGASAAGQLGGLFGSMSGMGIGEDSAAINKKYSLAAEENSQGSQLEGMSKELQESKEGMLQPIIMEGGQQGQSGQGQGGGASAGSGGMNNPGNPSSTSVMGMDINPRTTEAAILTATFGNLWPIWNSK